MGGEGWGKGKERARGLGLLYVPRFMECDGVITLWVVC